MGCQFRSQADFKRFGAIRRLSELPCLGQEPLPPVPTYEPEFAARLTRNFARNLFLYFLCLHLNPAAAVLPATGDPAQKARLREGAPHVDDRGREVLVPTSGFQLGSKIIRPPVQISTRWPDGSLKYRHVAPLVAWLAGPSSIVTPRSDRNVAAFNTSDGDSTKYAT